MRRVETAVLLAIGTELTTGATRDTNGGDLAAELTALGVGVARLVALPDDLVAATEAVRAGLREAVLVVTTGGLGPTPDDLTREAIAAALGEVPAVDPDQAVALQRLFERRGVPMACRQLQAGMAHPECLGPAEPQRHGPRLVGGCAGRPDRRGAPRAAPRDAAHVARPRPASPPRDRPWGGPSGGRAAADRGR